MDIKKQYKKIENKFKLPNFDKFDKEFEISTLDTDDFLLRNVRRRMNNKLTFFTQIFDTILFPNPNSLISMHESKSCSEEEKIEIMKFYNKLMILEREALSFDIEPDDKKEAEFINKLWKQWTEIKKETNKLVEKMKESWKDEDKKIKNHYFG
ncbi:MAG: hypothetical protein ABIJ20_03745 [Nanoarchaeota archaeon]|nr:hypothetical protein [Nanoarchaeota archaeon]MBU1445533.1 hypothetical protein [Nanoarchaeota archaeon]MBU2406357.1 hypothetical protein [Nanoarchaeota archaeon]MBU2420632.1 hypothetical protein [Nanoarchaeota archaeon]MBU2474920.1 hypothetical protein [Nanoarchaeota archaeon]